ncbi:MAG: PepSY-associated TM helix domain-containing protein [Pseudomonadota bacterium]
MRSVYVLLHRWMGLATALFLFIAGLTGAVISWDHALDEWLNPSLFHAATQGRPLPVLDLANKIELSDKRGRITYMPLEIEPGHTFMAFVQPRINPQTQQPYELGYNQVALDPSTGAIQAKRMWGKVSLTRENLLPFLYKLHYSLHIPQGWGIELGVWLMGIVGIVWVFDTLIAVYISFPNLNAWRKSFSFRWQQGGYRLLFDFHRSGGVWLWLLLFILAVTSVSMNLKQEVMRPIVSWFSTLSATPFDSRIPAAIHQPIEPTLPLTQMIAIASEEKKARGWKDPAGALSISTEFGVYAVGFFTADNSHGDGGLGNPWLYFDSRSGKPAGADIPGTGSAGDIFLQSMFPLHSGRIIGMPGRILVSLLGLLVSGFSVTGVYIWLKKRKVRIHARVEKVAASTSLKYPGLS